MDSYRQNIRWTLSLAITFLVLGLSAQNEKIAFEKYGVAEGLPEEYVSGIVQDDKGFIWCTTQNGLVKYDGYNFKTYKYSNDTTLLQLRNLNGGIILGKDGKIWVGGILGTTGIASFDPATENFNNFKPYQKEDKNQELIGDYLLLEDEKGHIWYQQRYYFNSRSILCRLDPKTGISNSYPQQLNYYWSINEIAITEAANTVWLLDSQNHLLKFDAVNDSFEVVLKSGTHTFFENQSDTLRTLFKGKHNKLLLTGDKGLYIFDTVSERIIDSYTETKGLTIQKSKYKENYAIEDNFGSFWFFQDGGFISIINPNTQIIQELEYGKGPLQFINGPDRIFRTKHSFHSDKEMWLQVRVYNQRNISFIHYDYDTKKFELYDPNFNLTTNPLPETSGFYKFMIDQTGLLWLGTRPGLYKQAPKTHQFDLYQNHKAEAFSLPSDTVNVIFEDSRQQLWVGTNNGLAKYQYDKDNFKIFRHNPQNKNSLSNNLVKSIVEDANGKIWIGTANGLNQLKEESGTFERTFSNKYENHNIRYLYIDTKNRLWVSILEKGIRVFDTQTNNVLLSFSTQETSATSLVANEISFIYEDSKGYFWLGNQPDFDKSGLYQYNEMKDTLIHFLPIPGDSSSLMSEELKFVVESGDNQLWVGTDAGMCYYDYDTHDFTSFKNPILSSCTSYTKDPRGNLWIGSYASSGLIFINTDSNTLTPYGENEGLLHNDILVLSGNRELVADDLSNICLPTERGLSVFNPTTKTFTNYLEKDGFQPYARRYRNIKTINGDVWIGGHHGLNRIVPSKLQRRDSSAVSVVITQISINDSIYSKSDGSLFKNAVPYTNEITLKHWQKDLSFGFVGLHFLRSEDNMYSWKLENYNTTWSEPISYTASQPRIATYTNLSHGTYIFKIKAANADGVWTEEPASITINILPPWWKTIWAYLAYTILFLGGLRLFSQWREKQLIAEKVKLESKVEERTSALKETVENLKSTQSKLIQSEKMASLGELTAGIAHEIQNPLNFVNNFSEVSHELVDEMNAELSAGNEDEAKVIGKNVKQNLEKITYHGKRADGIVKGMLLHSRGGSGENESTDINALCDEYLRLAYHGLRAKDKSFNVKMETDFDTSIEPINVVRQDMGRVILNLITNAFWAVNEKKNSSDDHYEPTVKVSTKKKGDHLIIQVADNGNGISDEVKEKIFQPFFTTKPTGQGTGLGLSLSYDIVKAHGGELKLETKEGNGTLFQIILPT